MNLLTHQLPDAVEIDGKEYKLRTDYRGCLKILEAFEDPDLSEQEKYFVLLNILFEEFPTDTARAIELGLKFINSGDEIKEPDETPMRLFSFDHDGNYIYAAFQQTHGIDLEKTNLHWWKFLALFMDLGSETAFCQLVAFRKRVKSGTATKEEMKEYRNNLELFDVPEPDTRTLQEKIAEEEFLRLVLKSENK
jgi:hypothetical protein